jgi:hypothetical protein
VPDFKHEALSSKPYREREREREREGENICVPSYALEASIAYWKKET